MFDLRKLFVREARAHKSREALDPDSDYHPSDRTGDGLEVEYQSLIASHFRRWGIAPGSVTIEVRKLGRAPDGFDVLVGMVRLVKWERESALRLLIGLPLLEAKVRKTVRAAWLADYSHFAGLWLHASEQLNHTAGMEELRHLLMHLAPPSAPSAGAGAGQATAGYPSSLPPAPSANSQGPSLTGASETEDVPVPG